MELAPGAAALGVLLVVAPSNMQVRALRAALPNVQVGSVDKLQGQEAPVVIVSMCANSGDVSPRGIEFLFSTNRLNVELSRAQSLAIVVGCPDSRADAHEERSADEAREPLLPDC